MASKSKTFTRERPGKEIAVKTSQKYNKYRIKYKHYDIIYNKQIAII